MAEQKVREDRPWGIEYEYDSARQNFRLVLFTMSLYDDIRLYFSMSTEDMKKLRDNLNKTFKDDKETE